MLNPTVPTHQGPYSTGAFALHPEAVGARPLFAAPPAVTSYPSVSWREWCNPIRDQGPRGYCVGFGVARAVEIITSVLFGRECPVLSPQDLYARALTYDGLDEWRNANHNPEGTWVWAAADALFKEGAALEADCPFTPQIPVRAPDPQTRLTTEYCTSGDTVGYGVDNWKAMLQKGPIACVFICDAPLFSPKNGIVDYDGSLPFNSAHCLCLTGWDSDTGLFEAAGSWNTGYGLKGYIYLTEKWAAARGADGTLFTPDVNRKIGGDLNEDTRINYADVLEALMIVTGQKVVNDFVKHVLDVNGDQADNVRDAMELLRKSVGLL